ncbi:MAG: DUF4013 domain-containing protein [Gloeotrichia echinulata HAB0833]
MNLVQGFSYVTKDPKWFEKMLIGALITSVPILEAITNGYQLQTIRNLLKGQESPLPEWQGMDKLFGNGFRLYLAVWMIYIPAIVLEFVGWVNGLNQLFSLLFYATHADTQTTVDINTGRYIVKIIVSALYSLLMLVLPIVFLMVPSMALRCATKNSFLETINIFAHFKFILRNLGDYVLAKTGVLVMLFLFSLLASVVGGITFFIVGFGGWFVLSLGRFWGRMMWAYYLAQMEISNRHLGT